MPKLPLIAPRPRARPGRCVQEWVENVVSATDVAGSPAKGEATLGDINGENCLVLDSETVVKSGPHRANTTAMREMFAMGPSDGSKGVHNEKGIGLRLLQAKLGGKESDAAELIVITVDAQTKIGSIARAGPKVNERYGDGTNLARVVMGFSVIDNGGTTRCQFDLDDRGGGPVSAEDCRAERIMCQSEHPFQHGENSGRTKRRLMELAAECFDLAKDEPSQQFTRFIYFNIGSTDSSDDQEPVPLLKAVDGRPPQGAQRAHQDRPQGGARPAHPRRRLLERGGPRRRHGRGR